MIKIPSTNKKGGYIALIAVLILSMVALVLATTFTEISIGEGQASRSQVVGEDVLGLAESCTEEALMQIQNDAAYYGPSVILPEGSCSISVWQALGIWVLYVTTASNTSATRSIRVYFYRTTQISILSWLEL
jgi:hypothetical protein